MPDVVFVFFYRFNEDLSAHRLAEGFKRVSYIKRLKNDTPSSSDTDNSMIWPTGKVKNVVTHNSLCSGLLPPVVLIDQSMNL